MFGIFADLLSSVITVLFPVFASFKALRSSDPAQLAPWLMYWVVLSIVLMAESWTVFILGWFPFYSWIRLFCLSYLVLPQTQGARLLYQQYIDPFLEHHEREIELFIGRTHEQAKQAGLGYLYQLIDLIKEKVLGMPPSAPTTAAAPSSAGAYAQSLLSRFNLPSTVAAAAGNAPAADFYSLLSSAVTAVTSTNKDRDTQAQELSASGSLFPVNLASSSHTEKAEFLSSQRERLDVLRSALDREQKNLDRENDLAYGASYGLRKNRSDHSFDHIEPEDLGGDSGSSAASGPRTPRRTSGGWTSGWFGGTGEHGSGADAGGGVDFAAKAVDEIAKATGVDTRRF